MGVFDDLSESAAFIKNGGSQAPQFLFDGGDKFDYGSASLPSCRSAAITCGSMVSTLSALSEIDSMSLLTSHCVISGFLVVACLLKPIFMPRALPFLFGFFFC